MTDIKTFFATSPKGIEPLVVKELEGIGANCIKQTRAGVSFEGTLGTAYRACLWLRTANRVLMPISEFPAETPEELYENACIIDWNEHLDPNGTIGVDFNASQSNIKHTHFGALKVKDAVVDQFRERYNVRPSIDLDSPDLRINVYLLKNRATVSIDLSGDSLHKRGYRKSGSQAPMKENLAAAILMRAGWIEIARQGGGLIDPMCGSGTLPIEAALIAADSAPGLLRNYFGFLNWKKHRPDIWDELIDEAEKRELEGFEKMPYIVGYDANPNSITAAIESSENAGLASKIHFEKREFADCEPHPKMKQEPGLFVINPPYGIRLGELEELKGLYLNIGRQLKSKFFGWNASIFTGNLELGQKVGVRAKKKYQLYNGALHCSLLNFEIIDEWIRREDFSKQIVKRKEELTIDDSDIKMLANRLNKNRKRLKSWIKKEFVSCYRIYDKDIPEFAVSIDIFENFVNVQEYKPPESVDPQKAKDRLNKLIKGLPTVLNIPKRNIFLKTREKQKGRSQYQKKQNTGEFYEVEENGCKFLVNFMDYLDTGLFLDHRNTRRLIGQLAKGKRFLNLFCYTGSATVYAAKGGAKSSISIDLSKHYLQWARKNLSLNGFSDQKHKLIAEDALTWLENAKTEFDLIFLDPPTFSNSKKTDTVFDIQKDHIRFIRSCLKVLSQKGILIFSNNYRRFKMDHESLKAFSVEEITSETIPFDFSRSPRIHNCWKITHN